MREKHLRVLLLSKTLSQHPSLPMVYHHPYSITNISKQPSNKPLASAHIPNIHTSSLTHPT